MKPLLATLSWLVIVSFPLLALAGEAITEAHVTERLYGRHKASAQVLPSFVITVSLPAERVLPARGKGLTGEGKVTTAELSGKLLPLGRALTSDVLQGFRFAITVRPDSALPPDHQGRGALQVAQAVKRYLVEHFAIDPERLRIAVGDASSPATLGGSPSQESQRWQVEVTRLQ
jgi:hypothetical protein